MHAFPHQYTVSASGRPDGDVAISGGDLPELATAPPPQFDGPGDRWSPEELLVGAVANCFILTFRAIARASKLEWTDLECSAEGTLDRVDRVTKFTAFTVRASLTVPGGSDADKAAKLLEKAENSCLITRSLEAGTHLEAEVIVLS